MIGDDEHGRPTWLTVAMGAAAGFLVGVVLVVLLTPDESSTTRTVTAPTPHAAEPTATIPGAEPTATTPAERPPPTAPDDTVAVPDVAGEQLDVARERVEAAGFAVDVSGGGAFGVIEESNWVVGDQTPPAGQPLAPGDVVTLTAERPG